MLGVGPAHSRLANDILPWNPNILEEHFIKPKAAFDGLDRTDGDPARIHRHEEKRDALLRLDHWVGAHEEETPVCLPRIAGPDFLAIDHPFVAVQLGSGSQVGKIGTGARLGKALTPKIFTAQ